MEKTDLNGEGTKKLRRNNGQMLSDALSVMMGIKPMTQPLGYKEEFDSSDLFKYIQDFSFENDSARSDKHSHIANESCDRFTNKEKLQYSIQVVQRMINRVQILSKAAAVTNKQLRDLWNMQLDAQRELDNRNGW